MSLFAIVAFDAINSQNKRAEHRESHVTALAELKSVGRLFAGGSLKASLDSNADCVGSILIIDSSNESQAKQCFDNEPYFQAGVYEDVTIKPYIDAMGFIGSQLN